MDLEKLDHIGLALAKLFLIRCSSHVQYLCSCMLDWFMVKRHVSVVAGTPQCTFCLHIICHVLPFIIVKLASLLFLYNALVTLPDTSFIFQVTKLIWEILLLIYSIIYMAVCSTAWIHREV